MKPLDCCADAFRPKAVTFRVVPCSGDQAAAYVKKHHRHLEDVSDRVRFACAIALESPHEFYGVGIMGSGARVWEGTGRCTITRCAVRPGVPNGCSMIYGALCRAAKALGYSEAWTYTLPEEPGHSLLAAGFADMGLGSGGEHDRPKSGRRRKKAKRDEPKRRWVRRLGDTPPWPGPPRVVVADPQLALAFPEVA